ncbi:hypothetical protein B0H14DRAFT_2939033 [Mycena olivaceomarginata]|nr:hypothetical protein B0H14DRAFT_2939033 [Mycena olivaceomarginata]
MPSTLHPAPNCRAPLAPKSNTGNVNVKTKKFTLPITLHRPELDEVEMMSTVLDMYPDLAGIPAEYIRDRLSLSTPLMIAALGATQTAEIQGGLPKELEIPMNEIVSAACPTHMFAIYSDTPLTFGQKRQISLYPCSPSSLPRKPDATGPNATVPVVPLCLPSPGTFPLLHAYLYTQNPRTLAPLMPLQEASLPQLVVHATKVHGLWRNACALGVISPLLYEVIEESWAKTLTTMRACS